ncbi:type VI secretion system contractile sheath small subunit, partial [Klebsiella pneumoniae]|nr:type VI secretion system contractile sheath small subunit [Klebsiella pneumoniae]
RLDVKLNLPLGEQGSVELDFTELESFHPDELYRNLALFSQLSSLRKQLNDTATFAKAAATVQGWADGKARKASRTSR